MVDRSIRTLRASSETTTGPSRSTLRNAVNPAPVRGTWAARTTRSFWRELFAAAATNTVNSRIVRRSSRSGTGGVFDFLGFREGCMCASI
jgi:hypothetical protein